MRIIESDMLISGIILFCWPREGTRHAKGKKKGQVVGGEGQAVGRQRPSVWCAPASRASSPLGPSSSAGAFVDFDERGVGQKGRQRRHRPESSVAFRLCHAEEEDVCGRRGVRKRGNNVTQSRSTGGQWNFSVTIPVKKKNKCNVTKSGRIDFGLSFVSDVPQAKKYLR